MVGVEGDWYQITVPEKQGYVHSDYLELIEEAAQYAEDKEGPKTNMFPAVVAVNILADGGGFFVFKTMRTPNPYNYEQA